MVEAMLGDVKVRDVAHAAYGWKRTRLEVKYQTRALDGTVTHYGEPRGNVVGWFVGGSLLATVSRGGVRLEAISLSEDAAVALATAIQISIKEWV